MLISTASTTISQHARISILASLPQFVYSDKKKFYKIGREQPQSDALL